MHAGHSAKREEGVRASVATFTRHTTRTIRTTRTTTRTTISENPYPSAWNQSHVMSVNRGTREDSRKGRRMCQEHEDLWNRIAGFSFDEGGECLTFACRLCRENGWSEAYSSRVIEEYRRFMFLATVAGHSVTPSDQVDQVWHLHLVYTRSYWDRWCNQVLNTPIHHGPTKGGRAENDKFTACYEQTKQSY